ncbi:MAG: threonine synthase [Francisellaceae bacterium]|jgi:threonine synthase
MYEIIDFKTKKNVTTDDLVFAGEDSPWEVNMDIEYIRSKINIDYFTSVSPCLSKYLSFLPITNPSSFVSLRETATPLIKSKKIGQQLGIDLYFKVEGKNPTGSFKDRGSAVDISVAKEFGAKGIILASTGNMAASCSCYAAAAKLPCYVVVPEGVSMSKMAQVISYGGKIVQVKGSYNDAAKLAYTIAKKMGLYLAGDYAFRVEGQKTAAFELVDQMLYQVPDQVVIPIGCGTNITAYAKGFKEYNQLGLIDKTPKLIGVQAEGANAVVLSYQKNMPDITLSDKCNTLATAIAVPNPIDASKALDAIYTTNGSAGEVSDREMLEAQYMLSTEEGLFVESASAATLALLIKQAKNNELALGEKIVCILSGDGLKDPNVILKSAIKPPTINPDEEEFFKLYNSDFFANKTMVFEDRDEIIFTEDPTVDQVKAKLDQLLGAKYDDDYLGRIMQMISSFLIKGKSISIADFQDIVQDVREHAQHNKQDVFKVTDFSVSTGKDKISKANVKVMIADETYQAESEGVGPVDAVIQALSLACKGRINYDLTEYKVGTRGSGANSVVFVELVLKKESATSLGHSASPDIIQASLEAFEDAYNGFN